MLCQLLLLSTGLLMYDTNVLEKRFYVQFKAKMSLYLYSKVNKCPPVMNEGLGKI